MIALQCPNCNRAWKVSHLLAGLTVICTGCQTRIDVVRSENRADDEAPPEALPDTPAASNSLESAPLTSVAAEPQSSPAPQAAATIHPPVQTPRAASLAMIGELATASPRNRWIALVGVAILVAGLLLAIVSASGILGRKTPNQNPIIEMPIAKVNPTPDPTKSSVTKTTDKKSSDKATSSSKTDTTKKSSDKKNDDKKSEAPPAAKWQAMLDDKTLQPSPDWKKTAFLAAVAIQGKVVDPKQFIAEMFTVNVDKDAPPLEMKKAIDHFGPPDKQVDLKGDKKIAVWGPLSLDFTKDEIVDAVGVEYWLAYALQFGADDADALIKTGKIYASPTWPPAEAKTLNQDAVCKTLEGGGRYLIAIECFNQAIAFQPRNGHAILGRADAIIKLAGTDAVEADKKAAVIEEAKGDLLALATIHRKNEVGIEANKILKALEDSAAETKTAKVDPKTDTKTDTKTDSKTDPKIDPKDDKKAETKVDPAETKVAKKDDTKVDPKVTPKVDKTVETKSDPKDNVEKKPELTVAKWQTMLGDKTLQLGADWKKSGHLAMVAIQGKVVEPKEMSAEVFSVAVDKKRPKLEMKKTIELFGPPDKKLELKDDKTMALWGPLSLTYTKDDVVDAIGVEYWLAFALQFGAESADALIKTGRIYASPTWPPPEGKTFNQYAACRSLLDGGRHLIAIECFNQVLAYQPKNSKALLGRADAMLKLAAVASTDSEKKAEVIESARRDLTAVAATNPESETAIEAAKILKSLGEPAALPKSESKTDPKLDATVELIKIAPDSVKGSAKNDGPAKTAAKGIWPRATVARLVLFLPFNADLNAELRAADFPPLAFDEKRFKTNLGNAVDAIGKDNWTEAKMRLEATTTALFGVSYNMYLFADSEPAWPEDGGPLKMRVRGVRVPTEPGKAMGNFELSIVAARLAKEAKDDAFDVYLTAARMNDDGSYEGLFSGKLPGGGRVDRMRFVLRPWRTDNRAFEASSK